MCNKYFRQINCFLLFSRSVVFDCLRPHGLQHTRLLCPSLSPRACSNSCPSSWWCHPTNSSSVIPFSSCSQSFPASGSFLMNRLFASGDQSTGASVSALLLPMNIQDWFLLGLTGLINLLAKIILRAFSSIKFWKRLSNTLVLSLLYGPTLKSVHDYWKNHSSDYTMVLWRPTRSSRTSTHKKLSFSS